MKSRTVIWLVIFVLAEGVLLANNAALDTWAWRTTRWFMGDQDAYSWGRHKAAHAGEAGAPFYDRVDPPMTRRTSDPRKNNLDAKLYSRTEKFWRLFRDLGEPQMTAILVVVVVLYDRRGLKAGAILAGAAALAGGAGMLIRATAGRLRPDGKLLNPDTYAPLLDSARAFIRNDGGNHWYPFRGFSFDASDLAFPSGHATLAFATAAVLSYLSPRGRWLFFTLAVFCALTRVIMQAHFYSDAILGAALGTSIGYISARFLDRALTRGDALAPSVAEAPASSPAPISSPEAP